MMSYKHNQLFVKLLFLSAMCMASVGAMATDRVLDVGHHGLDSVLLAPYIAVLEDPDQKLTLSDVQQPNLANQFALTQATAQDLNYGFTRSAYWFRLTLQNDSNAPVYRMLEISFPTLSDIQFYQPTTGGSYRVLKTGVALPFSTRAYPNRFFVFPIALPVRSMQTYYLRVQSVSGILIPARLWEPQAFHVHERNEYAIQTGYFGIAAALIFYNLFLYFGLRDIVYLLYSIFATTMALAISAANGIGMEYIWPETSFWSNISLNVLYSLALGALLIFFRRILDISAIAPRVDRLLKVLIGAMFLFPVGFVVSMETFAESSSILQAFAGVVILTVLLYCACFKGHRIAALLATSFSMLLIGGAHGRT